MPGCFGLAWILAAALAGCEAPAPEIGAAFDDDATIATRGQALSSERVVLDQTVSAEGARQVLAGAQESVPAGTDTYRIIVLDAPPEGLGLSVGARVLDARFVADGAVVLGADRVLRHHTAHGVRELDHEVLGPLSTQAGQLAYVRGEPPDLFLTLLDLSSGQTRSPAPQLAPAWSPALSSDGREVIFAASHEGRPQLFRLDAAGELHFVPTQGRTPSSPVAPLWRDDTLSFEDEGGAVRLDLTSGEEVSP